MNKSKVYFIHALSPLHPGVGQGVGSVDLPVAREKVSGIPYLPGSSVKGVLRDSATHKWPAAKVEAIFGPSTERAHEHAGAAQFGDAKLLLLPVRSYAGVFAYATSPYLLKRFVREAQMAGLTPPDTEFKLEQLDAALVGKESAIVEGRRVYLEDLDFEAQPNPTVTKWESWLSDLTNGLDLPLPGRLLILHDDVMSFLLETALEVVTRIRIDGAKKTVAKGALWFEENIPAESLLYGLLSVAGQSFGELPLAAEEMLSQLKQLVAEPLQFGGNATVGRGVSKMAFADDSKGEKA